MCNLSNKCLFRATSITPVRILGGLTNQFLSKNNSLLFFKTYGQF